MFEIASKLHGTPSDNHLHHIKQFGNRGSMLLGEAIDN